MVSSFYFFTIRWNSLHSMLERFDKVKNCILKSLIGSSISFDEEELNMIHNLVTLLEPVKLAVEALCRRDATLLSADKTQSRL
jgi:wyosine [tRNA(Phe)-imidazoG37] synthetase (radical SAM superfamily)